MQAENNHNIVWDRDKIKRFWDYAADCSAWQDDYFSKQVGKGIINFIRIIDDIHGKVLDYGCGPGYLAGYMLDERIAVQGIDSSQESVAAANARFSGNQYWGGAQVLTDGPLPYDDNTFDLIICIETIEHMLDEDIQATLAEMMRILRPGGKVLLSTPNEEDIEKNSVYCPECGAIYHRYQHIRSYSTTSLQALAESYGYHTILCGATDFMLFQQTATLGFLDLSPRILYRRIKHGLVNLRDCLKRKSILEGTHFQKRIAGGPHLFWYGSK